MGFLDQIPDLSSLGSASSGLSTNLNGLTEGISQLSPSAEDSPLASLWSALTDLSEQLDIDLSGIGTELPGAIQTISNCVPAGLMESVEAIDQAYTAARDFLDNNEFVQSVITAGGSPADWATETAQPLIDLLQDQLGNLTGNVIDGDFLEQLTQLLDRIQALSDDLAGNSGDLLPLISEQLFGVADDALDAVQTHAQTGISILDAFGSDAVSTRLGSLHTTFRVAFDEVTTTVSAMDMGDASAYVDLEAKISAAESALNTLMSEAEGFIGELASQIAGHSWESLFGAYPALLDAIDIGDGFALDDIFDEMQHLLESLFSKMMQAFGPEDVVAKVETVSNRIQEEIAASPIQQIQPILEGILGEIQEAIEAVPTEVITETVMDMIGQARAQVDGLGISAITDGIEQAFEEAESFIQTNLEGTVQTELIQAVNEAAAALPTIDAGALVDAVTEAVAAVDALVADVKAELDSYVAFLRDLLGQLEGISYAPISNEIIEEIEDVTDKLSQIDANALSEAEKLLLQAALSVLTETGLDDKMVDGIKDGYHAAEGELKKLLERLSVLLDRLRDSLSGMDLTVGIDGVNVAFDVVTNFLDDINGKRLMQPVYDLAERLESALTSLSPGDILDGLQIPYDQMMAVVNRVDPDAWTAPLNDLYARIDELLAYLDITPAFDYLDQLQNDLFTSIRNGILDALDGAGLPEPAAGFLAALRPTLESMTTALFSDPEGQAAALSESFNAELSLSTLLKPIDDLWYKFVDMLAGLPESDLETVFETIRQTFGVGLTALNPANVVAQLNSGLGLIESFDPRTLLGPALGTQKISLQWQARASLAPPERAGDVASISARLDAVAALTVETPGSSYSSLVSGHRALMDAYRRAVAALNPTQAQQSYDRIQQSLGKMVPDFLLSPTPIDRADIVAGLRAMRPSAKAEGIETVLNHFLAKLAALQTDLAPSITGMLAAFGSTLRLINPLALKAGVEDIYLTISEKARILDPSDLADAIRSVFQPLMDLLDALNPETIKTRLNTAYTNTVNALTGVLTTLLDAVTGAIDEKLRPIRESILEIVATVRASIEALLMELEGIIAELGDLIFNDVLASVNQAVCNLGQSFDTEIDRIFNKFNQMLGAIPLGGGASASVSV